MKGLLKLQGRHLNTILVFENLNQEFLCLKQFFQLFQCK